MDLFIYIAWKIYLKSPYRIHGILNKMELTYPQIGEDSTETGTVPHHCGSKLAPVDFN